LDDCQSIFDAVEVKTFQWKRDGSNSVGFIAQDVKAALPANGKFVDIVNHSTYQPSEEDDPMEIHTLDYSRMAAVLWGVVKKQSLKIAQLEARVATLEGA
jgi:hypothetical protein